MIARIWHGWTTQDQAEAYEALLRTEVFETIRHMEIAGYRGIELLRRQLATEVEFITIMRFETIDDIRAFAGEDYENAYVPDSARALLSRFDARSQHYQVRIART